MKRILLWIVMGGLFLLLIFTSYTFSIIYRDVKGITLHAKTTFEGDAVQALTELVKSDSYGYELKNTAIWALGQIADPVALPFLEELNRDVAEDIHPFDRSSGLSKLEIERAMKWCRKGNATSWMYMKIK